MTYCQQFASEDKAYDHMLAINRTSRDGTIYCLVDGPEDDYAVVDLRTATELGAPYEWAV